MKLNLPYKVRAAIYIFTALGSPVVMYLFATHIIGQLEVTLWAAEVSVANTIALLNTSKE